MNDDSKNTVGDTHTPLRQAVVEAIRDRIFDGRYAPASRLYEESVAAELGVSRNPIREAFQTLAAEGFVVIEPRRGARVASIDAHRANEIFEVRQALEGLVAALAAVRSSPEQTAELGGIVAEGEAAVERGSLAELPRLNTRFHRQLGTMAGNELLADTLDQLSGIIRWIYAERLELRVRDSWHEHRVLLAAIIDRDPDAARQCATDHVASAHRAYATTGRQCDADTDAVAATALPDLAQPV